jgi:hypothetical protein
VEVAACAVEQPLPAAEENRDKADQYFINHARRRSLGLGVPSGGKTPADEVHSSAWFGDRTCALGTGGARSAGTTERRQALILKAS